MSSRVDLAGLPFVVRDERVTTSWTRSGPPDPWPVGEVADPNLAYITNTA